MKVFEFIGITIRFIYTYTWDLIYSNYKVVIDVLTTKEHFNPRIIGLHVDLDNDFQLALLMNLITFTPGSISLDYLESTKTISVHILYPETKGDIKRNVSLVYVPFVKKVFPWK